MEGDMKPGSLFNGNEKATIKLSEHQLFSVRGKNIEIHCLCGNLWVTWPNRGERILKGGQTFRVPSRGKVCIMAFSSACLRISKRRWAANAQTHRESAVTNRGTGVLTIPLAERAGHGI